MVSSRAPQGLRRREDRFTVVGDVSWLVVWSVGVHEVCVDRGGTAKGSAIFILRLEVFISTFPEVSSRPVIYKVPNQRVTEGIYIGPVRRSRVRGQTIDVTLRTSTSSTNPEFPCKCYLPYEYSVFCLRRTQGLSKYLVSTVWKGPDGWEVCKYPLSSFKGNTFGDNKP